MIEFARSTSVHSVPLGETERASSARRTASRHAALPEPEVVWRRHGLGLKSDWCAGGASAKISSYSRCCRPRRAMRAAAACGQKASSESRRYAHAARRRACSRLAAALSAMIRGNVSFIEAVKAATAKCTGPAWTGGQKAVKELSSDTYVVAQCDAGCVVATKPDQRVVCS